MTAISGICETEDGTPVAGRVIRVDRLDTGARIGEAVSDDGEGPAAATSGLVFTLDAKAYSSGQTWANQVSSPADSSSQAAYDYYLGSSASSGGDDPTINSSGADDAYWSFDGGDYFSHTLSAGSMPEFLRKMHHGGKAWSIEIWMQWSGSNGSGICPLFDSGTSDQGGSDMSRGVMFGDLGDSLQTPGRLRLRVKRDSGAGNALAVESDAAIPSGSVQMLAVSYEAGGASFFYRNGDYMPVAGANTFTATLSSPGSSDAVNSSRLGARGDTSQRVPNGTRVFLMRVYNRALGKSELDANWEATKGRYGFGSPVVLDEGEYSINCGSYAGPVAVYEFDPADLTIKPKIHFSTPE